ncbi:MAG TPA: helix-turn-helix domain-containing protein [Ruminiclostridium sp.]
MLTSFGVPNNLKLEIGFEDHENHIFVNSCGYLKLLTKDFSISRENGRSDFQIIYIIKGKCLLTIDNKSTWVNEGNMILYKPNEPQFYSYFFTDSTEVYWIHFSGYGASEFLKKLELLKHTVYPIVFDNKCNELFSRIINELQIQKSFYEQSATAYFCELLVTIARLISFPNENHPEICKDDLKKVIEMMHLKYYENHQVSFFARECNLNLFRFMHKFKALTGMSTIEYLTRIRVNIAKNLLLNSSLSISDISSIVGYENPLYFSRVFKKETGISPRFYNVNCFIL